MERMQQLFDLIGHRALERAAMIASVLLIVSVVSANLLSRLSQSGDLPTITIVRSDARLKKMAGKAPAAAKFDTVTISRSVGIDGVTTASIAHPDSPVRLPCGDLLK